MGGDVNAELGRVSVGPHTLNEGNKRGDWMNTMYRKTLGKQATYKTPKGAEKQLDYMLVDRTHIHCSRGPEANDMIHMGSDHRSVMAQFVITAPKKKVSQKKKTLRQEEDENSREHKEPKVTRK